MISILLVLLFPYLVTTELIDWPLTKMPTTFVKDWTWRWTHTFTFVHHHPLRSSVLGRTNGYGVQTGRRKTTEEHGHGYGVDGDTFLAGLRNTILQKIMLKIVLIHPSILQLHFQHLIIYFVRQKFQQKGGLWTLTELFDQRFRGSETITARGWRFGLDCFDYFVVFPVGIIPDSGAELEWRWRWGGLLGSALQTQMHRRHVEFHGEPRSPPLLRSMRQVSLQRWVSMGMSCLDAIAAGRTLTCYVRSTSGHGHVACVAMWSHWVRSTWRGTNPRNRNRSFHPLLLT